MSKVKCYSIDIKNNVMDPLKAGDDFNKITEILKKYNVLGVSIENVEKISHCLFPDITERYFAFEELIKAKIECEMNPFTFWVDEKYMK